MKIVVFCKSLVRTFEKVYTRSSTFDYDLLLECEVNVVSSKSVGVIVSYRKGPKAEKPKECILRFPSIESGGEAGHLIGRKVAWSIGKHKVRGKIVAFHGRNGLVRARFRKGVPGQALGSLVEIIG